MCDTFIHISPDKTRPLIFGKNSDREPNEAQQIVRYPRQTREKNMVKTSFIEVDHPLDIFEVILSKPFQLWGAEMGMNEHGVTIGNEAVFTKIPFEKKNNGLTGMDMIRLALEISKTAKEALEHIIGYVEQYGQDTCGGYTDTDFYYHNAFIIADKTGAYVLETAGNFWVYEKAKGYRAISNGLSIEMDYDGISKNAIDFARKKNWVGRNEDFSFKKAFSAYWMPKLARCESRRSQNESQGNSFEKLTVRDAMQILRSHKQYDFSPEGARTDSICMHASGLIAPHQTTGSMVAELRHNGSHTVWLTGTSSPCLSLYKPFYLGDDILNEDNFAPSTAYMDDSYWWQWERFNREVLKNYSERSLVFAGERDTVQRNFIEIEEQLRETETTAEQFSTFSEDCLEMSKNVMLEWTTQISKIPAKKHFFYDRYWNKQNKLAHIETV